MDAQAPAERCSPGKFCNGSRPHKSSLASPLSLPSVFLGTAPQDPTFPPQNVQPMATLEQEKPDTTASSQQPAWPSPLHKGDQGLRAFLMGEGGRAPVPLKCLFILSHHLFNGFLTHLVPERPEDKLLQSPGAPGRTGGRVGVLRTLRPARLGDPSARTRFFLLKNPWPFCGLQLRTRRLRPPDPL